MSSGGALKSFRRTSSTLNPFSLCRPLDSVSFKSTPNFRRLFSPESDKFTALFWNCCLSMNLMPLWKLGSRGLRCRKTMSDSSAFMAAVFLIFFRGPFTALLMEPLSSCSPSLSSESLDDECELEHVSLPLPKGVTRWGLVLWNVELWKPCVCCMVTWLDAGVEHCVTDSAAISTDLLNSTRVGVNEMPPSSSNTSVFDMSCRLTLRRSVCSFIFPFTSLSRE
mmetsp:Transcript_82757/g.138105  ORF Transcript_82757/g.138105 Transcript_82757/m.138105 type:complete len:223 (+) Transcript_82757:607-1275(+)